MKYPQGGKWKACISQSIAKCLAKEGSYNPVWVQPAMDFSCIIGLGFISVGVEAIFKNLNVFKSSILCTDEMSNLIIPLLWVWFVSHGV